MQNLRPYILIAHQPKRVKSETSLGMHSNLNSTNRRQSNVSIPSSPTVRSQERRCRSLCQILLALLAKQLRNVRHFLASTHLRNLSPEKRQIKASAVKEVFGLSTKVCIRQGMTVGKHRATVLG